ncbi:uncharacterized protein LOC134409406 [Elgaria multicarinata webbii]|uniref:uncharacterized protein LOC134409406 n=1 Tax=Elgaria multicarinata webbii TaxID=159646 RepID=UPI002FCCBE6D
MGEIKVLQNECINPLPSLLLCTNEHILYPSEQDGHPLSSPEKRHFGGDVLGTSLSGEGLRGNLSRKRTLTQAPAGRIFQHTATESPASFTFLPELPFSIFGPSSSAASPSCSQDSQPASSVARKILFGYDPMSRLGASSRSGSPVPFHTDLASRASSQGMLPPHPANLQSVGNSRFAKGARSGCMPHLAVEAARQGDGRGISPLRCFSFPCPHNTGFSHMLASHSTISGRLSNNQPVTMMTDPFVLDKLLRTFQIMRCSVDNISQELRVLNTHLANLSHHFSTLPHLGCHAHPEHDGPGYHH